VGGGEAEAVRGNMRKSLSPPFDANVKINYDVRYKL
jgi:hypothetical protein